MAVPGVGTVIGGLRIDAIVGRGGMGVVYRAHQLTLDRVVALKIIGSDLTGDPEFRERFRREARLAAAIDHPHVVPVLHAGEEDGHLFLVMRFVDGVDLATMIREHGPLDARDAALIVAQVADALDAAHARGLVHRDVKPANVLVTRPAGRWHVYLTDFGISKELRSGGLTRSGVVIGSLDYISPEALEGTAVDHRADVYSLGCLLFQALTGQVPFPRSSTAAQMYAHLHLPPPSVGAVRPELAGPLEPVLARALAKRPADRFETAGEFGRAALAAATAAAPGPAFSPRPPHQAHPNQHRPNQHQPHPGPGPAGFTPGPPTPPPAGWPIPTRVGSSLPPVPFPAVGATPGPVRSTVSRRTRWVIAAVLAAIVVLAGGVVAANSGGDDPGPVVAQLPPAGQLVGAPIRVGATPTDLIGGEGYVWTANRDGRTVTRIDPKSGATIETEVGGAPGALAVGHGKVWVWNYSSSVTPIDAATGAADDFIDTGIDFTGIVGGPDSVWFAAADRNQVGRIDMATGTYTGQLIDLPGRADSMAVDGGRLYVLIRAERMLITIDEATGTVTDRRPLPNDLIHVGTADGQVYLVGPAGMTELGPGPIDPDTIHPTGTWSGILFDTDSVWIADDEKHEVRRLSRDLQTPVAQPLIGVLSGGAIDFEVVDGILWMARGADDSVIRIQPTPL